MNFAFTADQRMLADGVRDFLAGECPTEAVHLAWTDGWSRTRWKSLAELGVVGLLVPEAQGGMGMTEVDLTLLLEAAGHAGLPEPLAEVAAVAAPLLLEAGGARGRDLAEQLAAGDLVIVPSLSIDRTPAHLAAADRVLVQDGDDLHLVHPEDGATVAVDSIDGARPTHRLQIELDQVTTAMHLDCHDALAKATTRGVWAASAQLVGVGRRMIEMATQYALEREQFGKPIGSFQAVKHQLADALVAVELARPLTHRAAFSLATDDPSAPLHAAMAKAVAAEAALDAAKAALQVHGAIGYTWEHDLHLWMKRAWSLAGSWGSTEHHWQAIEAAG